MALRESHRMILQAIGVLAGIIVIGALPLLFFLALRVAGYCLAFLPLALLRPKAIFPKWLRLWRAASTHEYFPYPWLLIGSPVWVLVTYLTWQGRNLRGFIWLIWLAWALYWCVTLVGMVGMILHHCMDAFLVGARGALIAYEIRSYQIPDDAKRVFVCHSDASLTERQCYELVVAQLYRSLLKPVQYGHFQWRSVRYNARPLAYGTTFHPDDEEHPTVVLDADGWIIIHGTDSPGILKERILLETYAKKAVLITMPGSAPWSASLPLLARFDLTENDDRVTQAAAERAAAVLLEHFQSSRTP